MAILTIFFDILEGRKHRRCVSTKIFHAISRELKYEESTIRKNSSGKQRVYLEIVVFFTAQNKKTVENSRKIAEISMNRGTITQSTLINVKMHRKFQILDLKKSSSQNDWRTVNLRYQILLPTLIVTPKDPVMNINEPEPSN